MESAEELRTEARRLLETASNLSDPKLKKELSERALQLAERAEAITNSIQEPEIIEMNIRRYRHMLLRYAHAFFNQVAQSAACAALHSLEQRCCRWMLMTSDRMQSDEFLLTQEFLAMVLGVRRAGVSVAAAGLQRDGLIRYRRGNVTVIDRRSLEQRSCECYGVSKREFDRLLGVD
jgi:CRP-like cAMP-binding protein